MVSFIVILALFASYPVNAEYTAAPCSQGQWTCQDRSTCIPLDGKCDGVIDCPDGSDERHAVCRKIVSCPPFTFRCTYGACVDGNAKCNGTRECTDGSDEIMCGKQRREVDGVYQCDNGDHIPSPDRCDGKVDCPDGSDETLASCAGRRCAASLFQCAYGACVDADAACDPYGTLHCADGSDEARDLCSIEDNRPSTVCTLPDYPAEGTYEVLNHMNTEPGQTFNSAYLHVRCNNPDHTSSSHYARCIDGLWEEKMIKCQSYCKVHSNEGVKYECLGYYGLRKCNKYEPSGLQMYPTCEEGYTNIEPRVMTCIDGQWDNEVKCKKVASCGFPSAAQVMMIGGAAAKTYEVPWHAGIYDRSGGDYRQICGGSLVSRTVVISAAHCFWNDVRHQLSHTNYAVTLGQLERQWNDTGPGQRFNVSSIHLPDMFQGETTQYRADIALVFLDKPAEYRINVRPVCLDLMNITFDQKQLTDGRYGKIAGWGLTGEDGPASDELIVNELPTLNNIQCISQSHPDFKRYIEDDKLCAGKLTGSALCEGDSGGGLVFREGPGKPYYLRGIASIRHTNNHLCNNEGYTTFTRVFHYAAFITNLINSTL